MSFNPKHFGFTLTELVAVILLVAILSVSVIPLFSSRDGYASRALRDDTQALFHFVRQRALDDHSTPTPCYRLTWNGSSISAQRNALSLTSAGGSYGTLNRAGDFASVTMTPATGTVYFDQLGNTFSAGCGTTAISTQDIVFTDSESVTLRIHGTGYAQRL